MLGNVFLWRMGTITAYTSCMELGEPMEPRTVVLAVALDRMSASSHVASRPLELDWPAKCSSVCCR